MGGLRTLLALGVVIAHAGSKWGPTGGYAAVETFFVISGFYMALIYGKYGTPGSFFLSRALRLYPTYFVALVIALAYYSFADIAGHQVEFLQRISGEIAPIKSRLHLVFVGFTNLSILFSEWLWFLPRHDNAYLILPPIWTVSLELMFYLLCPLLLKLQTRWLIVLALAGIAARMAAYELGASSSLWTDTFFPFELSFFIAGTLAFRAYSRDRYFRSRAVAIVPYIAVAVTPLLTALQPLSPVYGLPDYYYSMAMIAVVAICLPTTFNYFRRSRLDAVIGELSYPLYVIHYIFVELFIPIPGLPAPAATVALIVILSLAHAALLNWFVQRPVDAFRHAVSAGRSGYAAAPGLSAAA